MNYKKFLALTLTTFMSLSLMACGGSKDSGGSSGSESDSESKGGILMILIFQYQYGIRDGL